MDLLELIQAVCYFDENTARVVKKGHPEVQALNIGWPELELNARTFEHLNKRDASIIGFSELIFSAMHLKRPEQTTN